MSTSYTSEGSSTTRDDSPTPTPTVYKKTVRWKGVPVTLDAVTIQNQTFLIRGRMLRTAELRYFWEEDVKEPAVVIKALKEANARVDILKFWQRLPDVQPRHPFPHEMQHVAAIPVSTHKHWFEKQITSNARNKIRKAARLGVEVKVEPLTDDLIRRIMGVYNDSPVRRGKPFWHYGKDFETVKRELVEDLDRCRFLTAYHGEELIGFIKLLLLDRFTRTTLILDKQSRREKSPMNSLVSKAVEVTEQLGYKHFVYSIWRRGDHGQFQASVGFLRTPVPEYFVPLTWRGRCALALRLHRGLKARIPENLMIRLLELRGQWYSRKYGTKEFRVTHREQK